MIDAEGFPLLPPRAFRVLGRRLLSLEGGGKSSPKTPDYAGAAQATAQGNLEATRAAAAANRVNQYTPYGSLVYSRNPTGTFNDAAYNAALAKYQSDLEAYNRAKNSTGGFFGTGTSGEKLLPSTNTKGPAPVAPDRNAFITYDPDGGWAATQTLAPAEQAKLDKTNALSTGLLDTAQKGLGYVDQTLSTGGVLDESKLPQLGLGGQEIQDAIMSRLEPTLSRQREALRTQLSNQGLHEGSAAWGNAMTDRSQAENDLYIQAALRGIDSALRARQQGITEQYSAQERPLNIINALRTGNQINAPQFAQVPQQQTAPGADLLDAAISQGNFNAANTAAENAQASNLWNTVGAIGANYFL